MDSQKRLASLRRKPKPTERYVSWRGLRMLEASRMHCRGKIPKHQKDSDNDKVSLWLSTYTAGSREDGHLVNLPIAEVITQPTADAETDIETEQTGGTVLTCEMQPSSECQVNEPSVVVETAVVAVQQPAELPMMSELEVITQPTADAETDIETEQTGGTVLTCEMQPSSECQVNEPSVVKVVSAGVNVEQQADGTVIISLPPDFSEGTVNIPVWNSGPTANRCNDECESDDAWEPSDSSEAPLTDDESEPRPSRSRKRQRHEHTWKQKVRVKKRNSGQLYRNSRGKLIQAKKCPTNNVCSCKNDYQCSTVTVDDRQEIFNSFWHTENFDLQNATLCSLIDERPVARRTVQSVQNSSESSGVNTRKRYKNLSREYHLHTPIGRKKVCKEMFLSTFDVSNGRIDRALKNRRGNNGVVRADQRGRHVKHQIPDAAKQSVVEHISMFPRYVSHYTRSHQNSREYLTSDLNLKTMYRLYVEHCVEKSYPPVKESYYRQVFNSEFNLSFHQPMKDTCHKCDRFKILLDVSPSREVEVQRELHLRKAEKVRAKLSSAKESNSNAHMCFTFDLQKTLITPSISAGVAYYKRQLATYNFGIHNLANNDATMYMWHEGCASRGASEIGTCLWMFVRNSVQKGVNHITAFCDSCGGQNRNFKIATLMSHCVNSLPLESFTVHYMQSGHSYLPNDADFGVIERAKKASKDVYIPQQWMQVVQQARKQQPFTVVEMKSGDFLDLSATTKQLVNRKKATDGSTVKWLNIQSICFSKDAPQVMKYKHICEDDMEWCELDLRRGAQSKRHSSMTTLATATQQKKIKKKKFDDLQSLKPYVPPIYHDFYDNLSVDTDATDRDGPDVLSDEELLLSEDES